MLLDNDLHPYRELKSRGHAFSLSHKMHPPIILNISNGYVTQRKFCPFVIPECGYENSPPSLTGGK
uniref:Uncharacterized protein n=1 Tax=Anguilla anguilla TaxID=7936 RepID=A0A0E9RPZ2_ANGAN